MPPIASTSDTITTRAQAYALGLTANTEQSGKAFMLDAALQEFAEREVGRLLSNMRTITLDGVSMDVPAELADWCDRQIDAVGTLASRVATLEAQLRSRSDTEQRNLAR